MGPTAHSLALLAAAGLSPALALAWLVRPRLRPYFGERLGHLPADLEASLDSAAQPIYVHAASVGEAKAAARLIDRGAEVWILGSGKEAGLGAGIAREAGGTGAYNLCGQTSLVEAVELLALARAAVSNDSGLMHVSAAVGTHTVAIYGSSTPDFTPPLTRNATIHYRRLDCSPCFERTCPLQHLDCLNGISVDEVFSGVVERLGLE